MKVDQEQLRSLLAVTLATIPVELDCDEWLDRVARYAELHVRQERIPEEFSLVSQHLKVCPECREEFDSLVVILAD